MDVKTASLNGNLAEEVCIDQPIGFLIKGKEHILFKLKNSIYRLKQTSRNRTLNLMILSHPLDLRRNTIDRCIYLKVSGR